MGCFCGKDRRVQDSISSKCASRFEFVSDAANLVQFFSIFPTGEYKCVFIFGASGSSKGEFIWNLIESQKQSGTNDLTVKYLDVEGLIMTHLKRRITDLVRGGNRFCSNLEPDQDLESEDTVSETESTSQVDVRPENMKTVLQEFANVITSTWVFRLIQDEMQSRTSSCQNQRTIFLVNLIPNRISLFKRCLFLNQSPNLYQLSFDFIALNICDTKVGPNDSELELETSFSDSVNQMFVTYFRSVHKLFDIIWQQGVESRILRVRVFGANSNRGLRVKSRSELADLLCSHDVRSTLCVNVADIPDQPSARCIAFLVGNTIQIDKNTVLELDRSLGDLSKVKTLIRYLDKRESGAFITPEQKQPSTQNLTSPKSRLSVTFSDQ